MILIRTIPPASNFSIRLDYLLILNDFLYQDSLEREAGCND